MLKRKAAIIGSGNIGTDLMIKLLRSQWLEPCWMVGIDPESDGLKRADAYGLQIFENGLADALDKGMQPDIVFDATSAKAHIRHAKLLREASIRTIDLTPAARGPYVIAGVNIQEHQEEMNVNMVTCGGQATVPMVYAISRVAPVSYAEIIATIASKSAGPGTRQNIDEFTHTTATSLEVIGKAGKGKAIIILNPADPPILMRDTIHCITDTSKPDIRAQMVQSVYDMAEHMKSFVPGYRLNREPIFLENRISVSIEIEGRGDYLPTYAGNLDIMTASAVNVVEQWFASKQKGA